MARIGPKSSYTVAIGEEICRRLSNGEMLTAICATKGMPSRQTIYDWDDAHPDFARAHARAKILQAAAFVDQSCKIVDDATPEDVQVAKLRSDSRRWVAGKLDRAGWGDRTAHEVSGPDGASIFSGARDALLEKLKRRGEST